MTIKDYKDNSDSDIEIIVREVDDLNDPTIDKMLYSGKLGECPKELDSLTIEMVGRSLFAEQERGQALYYLFHLITQ